MKKKIAYVSGTRADFGLMTPVLRALDRSPELDLMVYATGMHVMPEFGGTAKEVEREFPQTKRIDAVFSGDGRSGAAEFIGPFIASLVKVFGENRPDFVLTLGDRVEMLSTAMACAYLGIPTGQIHGGEKTYTVDEMVRHAITKLSQLHFPATQTSAERIKRLGEDEWRIHVVGAPALDVILNEQLPSRDELFAALGLDLNRKFILLTEHPVSEEFEEAGRQMAESIAAVKIFGLPVVVSYPNADAGGRKIVEVINSEKNNPLFHIFPSLPFKQFLALEREAAVWVGNSSGAMIESASFKTPVVNVGLRQLGRERGKNVIDVPHERAAIIRAVEISLNDRDYLAKLSGATNPWGDGQTGPRIAKLLEDLVLASNLLAQQITY